MNFISGILVVACIYSIFDFWRKKYVFTFFRNIYTVNNKNFYILNTIVHIGVYSSLMIMAFALEYQTLRVSVWMPITILLVYEIALKKVFIKKGYITEKSKEEILMN